MINNCAKFTSGKAFFIKGQPYWGSSLTLIDNQASGAFKAIDVTTGQIKWEVATRSPMVAGVLATGGGLVFTGDAEGFFTAYDAETGKDLWNFQCGSGHHSGPITYTLDGRQYIAVCVGWGGWTAGFAGDGAPWLRNARRGNTLFVFALPEETQVDEGLRRHERRRRPSVSVDKSLTRPSCVVGCEVSHDVGGSMSAMVARLIAAWSLMAVLIACGGRAMRAVRSRTTAAAPPKALIVCAVPASMPRTGKAPDGTPQGLDVAVAERVGRILGRPVEFHWCASAECAWHCLPEGRCDVVARPAARTPGRRATWPGACPMPAPSSGWWSRATRRASAPWPTSAASGSGSWPARWPSRRRTTPSPASSRARSCSMGSRPRGSTPPSSTPTSPPGTCTSIPSSALRLVAEYVPRERWNMALAVRARDAQLLVEINRALAQLAESGELRKIYADHGVPFRPPFTATARQQASPRHLATHPRPGRAGRQHGPRQLALLQRQGRRPGVRRRAGPGPGRRLDVKLRIEWLDIHRETAVGELLQGECDLVLGEAVAANTVADDEELAGKVLYSRPYYGTGYVLVQRKDGPRAGRWRS